MEGTADPAQRDSRLVRETAELLSLGAPLGELFERFCTLLARFVDASVVFIALDSPRGVHLEFAYDHGAALRDAHVPVSPQSQTARVMRTGESLLMRGPDELPDLQIPLQIAGAAEDDTASAIFVPLRFGARAIGVLSVQSDEPGAYDERDRELIETCALYVAVAVRAEFMRTEKERVEAVATVDPVTGASTRRVFDERLAHEWNRARRDRKTVTVILMDIDHFKTFNDTYGHVAGDACLAQVAQAARSCIARSTDTYARYGGEEFAAILCDVMPTAALGFAERMRSAIHALDIPHRRAEGGRVTASFGAAWCLPDGDDPSTLLRAADRALYSAKASGRNRCVLQAARGPDAQPAFSAGNLFEPSTPFIGRASELDAVSGSLAVSRLTTMLGPGGVGKTRAALAAAQRLLHAYVHGVWFVDLAGARNAGDVDAVLVQELGVPQDGHLRTREAIVQYFADRHCLLVLDNCERIAREAAALCEEVIAHAPRTTMLATSREPLQSAHERIFRLGPLCAADAQRLFCERAAAAFPGVVFDAADRERIARICTRLDDLPLAIELAAARVKTMNTAQILTALDDRFDLLVSMRRDIPERQRTLAATIRWSYDLLDRRAKRLFERIAVFAGSFEAEAARDICAFGVLRPGEAAAALEEIAEKNLLAGAATGCERYRLLESVREFAVRRLIHRGEVREMAQRHLAYYTALAKRLGEQMERDNVERSIAIGTREWPEFRAALDCAFKESENSASAQALVLGLRYFWSESGRAREGRMWIDRLLETLEPQHAAREESLFAAALAAHAAADAVALHGYASELVAACRASSASTTLGRSLNALGNAEFMLGHADEAEAHYREALAFYQARGSTAGEAVALMNLGSLATDLRCDFEAGRTHAVEARAVIEPMGASVNLATVLANLGETAYYAGAIEDALQYARQSLAIFQRLGNDTGAAWQFIDVARYQAQNELWLEYRESMQRAQALLKEHPHREYQALFFETAFGALTGRGRNEPAARVAGFLAGYRERERVPRLPSLQRLYEPRLERVRAELGEARFDAAFTGGAYAESNALAAEILRP